MEEEGGGLIRAPPISQTTGRILKIEPAFDSPAIAVERNLILLTSGSLDDVTGQGKVKNIGIWSMFTLW